jgi:hypothetical protein
MPVFYDLRKDLRFKEGVKAGELQKARASSIRMLRRGEWSIEFIAEMLGMPLSFVMQIKEQLEKKPNLKK